MSKNSKRGLSCAALLVWMSVIYWFSAQNGEQSGNLSEGLLSWILSWFHISIHTELGSILHTVLRKLAHFSEYLILAVLIANVCAQWGMKGRKMVWIAVCASALYAGLDEWHQSFVGGRTPKLMDVGIDSLGALCGALLYVGFDRIWRHKRWK